MRSNASLFAHIQNDAFLSGTFKLEGNFFQNTSHYLKEYFEALKSNGEDVDSQDLEWLQKTQYLVDIEEQIKASNNPEKMGIVAKSIVNDLISMPVGSKILLPGGWANNDGGHAMVYQFTREANGYLFTVINSGGGLNYHSKKSSLHKELFNPLKAWSVPLFESQNEQREVLHFIASLLGARLRPDLQNKVVDADVLYNELLPNISYLNGKEINADSMLPEHAWTGGQLSGTCSQRVLHQMLKINSKTGEAYQRKIFKFKLYNLDDYTEQCFGGELPFTAAVADQIRLAIENNLKLLNTPDLFSPLEKEKYFQKLSEIQDKLRQGKPDKLTLLPVASKQPPLLNVMGNPLAALPLPLSRTSTSEVELPAPIVFAKNGAQFLFTLANAIKNIQKISDPAIRFVYLQQLILALPLNAGTAFTSPVYSELAGSEKNHVIFQQHIDEMQALLHTLRKDWLKEAETPICNHLTLSVLSLQTDSHSVTGKMQNLPDFTPFTNQLMQSLVENHERDPFAATNNPVLDARISQLQMRYRYLAVQSINVFYTYLNALIITEPSLDNELKVKYQRLFGRNTDDIQKEVRKHGLESLYMIYLDMSGSTKLEPHFTPLVDKIKQHLKYECDLRRAVNPFFENQLEEHQKFKLSMRNDSILVSTPLYPAHIPWQMQSKAITKHKYALKDSPARDALEMDISEYSSYNKLVKARTTNGIQLTPLRTKTAHPVTEADIIARDYFHLRTIPSMQIALTLDYFTRHIGRLSDESDQRYVEANLFQPGLLSEASKNPEFLTQFDVFLKKGLRYFTQNSLHVRDSLMFVRLNFLVSRYLALGNNPHGLIRLKHLQDDLLKQLTLATDPDVTYVLQQYLFLGIMARIEAGESADDLFAQAFNAYFYLKSHKNPTILEDNSHQFEVACLFARFQILISKQPEIRIKQVVESALFQYGPSTKEILSVTGNYPDYNVLNQKRQIVYHINAHQGKLFEKGLAKSGVPLVIQNHPLIQQEGLQQVRDCFMSADESYMILKDHNKDVHLFFKNNQLTIHRDWRIQNQTHTYELQALTGGHMAQLSNNAIKPIKSGLPLILTDGSMNYWQDVTDSKKGILVQNNIPIYSIKAGQIRILNTNGLETPHMLTTLNPKWRTLLESFESNDFLLAHAKTDNILIRLPRYDLTFEINTKATRPVMVCKNTDEKIVQCSAPIHPSVAGIVLKRAKQTRYLVPIARFYAVEINAANSDFYPLVHDIRGVIANASLEEEWYRRPPLQKPLWHYDKSETCASYQLKNGEPVADTVAEALYLVYIYLAANQTEKAWKTLNDCQARLGGLTGDPAELRYISWICNDLPHVLPRDSLKKAIRTTPPYVACQLKAVSLLCDYLSQDRSFVSHAPSRSGDTANSCYAVLQHKDEAHFLTSLPETIYTTFTRLQSMSRHLEHGYQLSNIERKRLLDYYHKQQPKEQAPQGALGYEWVKLRIEAMSEEYEAIRARRSKSGHVLSHADTQRLKAIERHFAELKPVTGASTKLELVAIDLDLPKGIVIRNNGLSSLTENILKKWEGNLPGVALQQSLLLEAATASLYSKVPDEYFIRYFPALLQVAYSSHEALRKKLLDFCAATLLAKRHIALEKQDTNLPLLCNILYRVLNNRERFNSYLIRQPNQSIPFTELVTQTSTYLVPVLSVYQAKDVYKHVLVTPEKIIADLDKSSPVPLVSPKLPAISLMEQPGIIAHLSSLDSQQQASLNEILDQYRFHQEEHTQAVANLGTTLINNNDPDHAFAIEIQAGKQHLAFEKEQKNLGNRLLQIPGLVSTLKTVFLEAEPAFKKQMEQAWIDALTLANQGPDDPERARAWRIQKASGARAAINKADLMSLYTRADQTAYMQKTGLSAEHAQRLHALIHIALVNGIRQQIQVKIINNLDAEVNNVMVALDLLAKPDIPGLDNSVTVVLQHEDNIVLRPRQVSALKALRKDQVDGQGFNETAEKVTMGDGKSKVITPIIAEQKARGDNLVVVEVPSALLATNYVDLNRTSQRLYGKRAYRFEFNRDSNCTPDRLEQLYQHFIEIMTTRSYLVTTGDAVQSLELKYLELLLSEDKMDKTREQQIFWLDKITRLFRNNADCLIDEIHQGLWLKKKLNYTKGESQPISPSLISNAIALYGMIDPEFISEAPSLPADYDWTEFKNTLAMKLVNNPASPLNQFVRNAVLRYGEEVRKDLVAYLTGTATTMGNSIRFATGEEQETLAFFKREIEVLLPQTLCQRLNEHYGPSKQNSLGPVEKTLAIPYLANNIPNERSRFGVDLEAINYTIQMMLLKGISKELLVERMIGWQALARQELLQNPALKSIDETPTGLGFIVLCGKEKLLLSAFVKDNPQHIAKFHARLQHNRALVFNILQEHSLKQIHQDAGILHSDSYNHVDSYRSAQGVSGTPSNYRTYHQRINYDKTSSLGSDGSILSLIDDKNTQISSLDYITAYKFIDGTLSRSSARERCRVISDIRAAFHGISNVYVAREIARYIRTNPDHFNTPVKHVLYFDEEQILCAIAVDKPDQPIILATSDTKDINRLLGSKPDERFTYYDQVHTEGADIEQGDTAHAIVPVDEKTHLDAFLQGSMRMRGLRKGQTMEISVPESLRDIPFWELVKRFEQVSNNAGLQDNPFTAMAQMTNHIRRHCLTRIQDLPSEDAKGKAALSRHFKAFFESTPSGDLFELYGALKTSQPTTTIFANFKTRLLALWRKGMTSAGLDPSQEAEKQISQNLQAIIEKAIEYCLPEYNGLDANLSMEVQIQKQIQKQVQVLALKDCYNPDLNEAVPLDWPETDQNLFNKVGLPLNTICSQTSPITFFSNNLMVSNNFATTYLSQKSYIGAFSKPVFHILYLQEKGRLQAMIITPEEAHKRASKLGTHSWIATTDDTFLAGYNPKGIQDDVGYQSLREQVRFFNGELTSLVNQDVPLGWLREKAAEKLDFFEHTLQSCRPGSSADLSLLKAILTKTNVAGFNYIAKHPYENLTTFDWKSLFPKIIPAQAAEYTKVAEAFLYANQNWMKKKVSCDDLQQTFNLSLNSLSYVATHLEHLSMLKKVLQHLPKISPEKSFLGNLSKSERIGLEVCLGMPLADFYAQLGFNSVAMESGNMDPQSWQLADSQALIILREYPAIYDKSVINSCLEQMAINAKSFLVLRTLMKMDELSDTMIFNIAHHSMCDASLVMEIMELEREFSEDLLIAFAKKCHGAQIDKLLTQPGLGDNVLSEVLDKDSLTQEQLLHILSLAKNHLIHMQIFIHTAMTPDVREALYQHESLSSKTLLYYAENRSENVDEVLLLLQHPTAVTRDVLESLAQTGSTRYPVLLSLITHNTTDQGVMRHLVQNPAFSPEIAQKILEQTGKNITADLLQQITGQVFINSSKATEPSQKLAWENTLIALIEYFNHTNTPDQLIKAIAPDRHYELPLRAAFAILRLFGRSMFPKLPLELMITTANDEEIMLLINFEKTGRLDENILILLLQKCQSSEQIDAFLARQDISESVFQLLLARQNLNEKQVLRILACTQSATTLEQSMYYINHKEVRKAICQNAQLSVGLVSVILKDNTLTGDDVQHLLNHPTLITSVILDDIINNDAIFSPTIAQKIAELYGSKPNLLPHLAGHIFKKCATVKMPDKMVAWEDALISIFERAVETGGSEDMVNIISRHIITPKLGIGILRTFGEKALAWLPLNDMIADASKETLDAFVTLETRLASDNISLLAVKIHTSWQIDMLLARSEMTSMVGDILFQKPEFSGKIGDWEWLTETQLIENLNKTEDFDSVIKVLKHSKLSISARETWFEKIRNQQIMDSQNADISKDPQQKIMAVLDGFKIKACTNIATSLHQENYEQVAKTAFNLYQDLRKEVQNHFESDVPNLALLRENCTNIINAARPVLEVHRGFKQALLDIVNVFMLCITFGLAKPHANDWRFFKVDTASVEEINKFSACIPAA